MARLIRRKCARNLIVVKAGFVPVRVAKGVDLVLATVKIHADGVKAGPVLAIVKTHADGVKVGPVLAIVKTHADGVKVGLVLAIVKTHADPAKAIAISLALNAMMPKVC